MRDYVARVNEAREYFTDHINREYKNVFHAYPSDTNFVLIRCSSLLVKKEILTYLERHNIFVRNVNQSENVKDCIRVTIGTKEQMEYVIKLFGEYIKGVERYQS